LIEVARRNATAELIKQKIVLVDREKKRDLLAHLIKEHNWFQVLVFTRTKHGANRLAEQLDKAGIPSLAIHGNKSQAARTRALKEFKDGSLQVLVATDIAARGIDIVELPHVVNFELPHVPEDYVHRIGRTGRAGVEGEALSLVCVDEHKLLRDIERVIKREFPKEIVPGFEPDLNARPEPIVNGQSRGQGAGRGSNPRSNSGSNPGRTSSQKPAGQRHGQNRSQPRSSGSQPRSSAGEGTHREVDGNRAQAKPAVDGNRSSRPSTPHRSNSGGRHR
jgi:ATP-dependent RNA helicase RhlE